VLIISAETTFHITCESHIVPGWSFGKINHKKKLKEEKMVENEKVRKREI